MGIWKLRLSMIGTLAIIFGLSGLFLSVVLTLLDSFSITTFAILVIGINVVQWLISPYLISALYRAKELPESENPQLHSIVENLSKKSGIGKPRLMLAQIPVPNAMAYGTPLSGNRIAVTQGLLQNLDAGQVEAVIGHELGHIKHKDVQIMMFVSLLPALLYYVGISLTMSSAPSRQKNGGSLAPVIGILFIAAYFVLYLFTLSLSRLREYYADRHSATIVDNGAQKLSTGLARIVSATKGTRMPRNQGRMASSFKALFITDPDRAQVDSAEIAALGAGNDERMVQDILSRRLNAGAKLMEIFSTHPNIIKRLKALREN
jgi:heat shock protein HtpX